MSKESVREDKKIEYLNQLENIQFKKFYLENPKEQKFLFSKVKPEELSAFSSTEFSLADVLKCRYIETYLEKRNFNRNLFAKGLSKYIRIRTRNKNAELGEKTRKYAVHFIEKGLADRLIGHSAYEFMLYDSFKRDEQRYLTEALIYIFKDKKILEKFKEDGYYKIHPLEAMLMFFILDTKNKEELKHIRFNEEDLIKRRFMNTLKRYASAISEIRGLSCDPNYIGDLYNKRLNALKSDLPAVRNLLVKAEYELAKNDKADMEKVVERVKKCRKKLKKFIKRYEQLSQDKVSK